MLRAAGIYRDNNQLLGRSVENFRVLLADLTVDGDAALMFWRGRFHLAGEKLPYRRDAAAVLEMMGEFLSRRRLGSVVFFHTGQRVLAEQILVFVRLFLESATDEDPPSWLDEKLRDAGCFWVQVLPVQEGEVKTAALDASPDGRRYAKARNAYFDAVETVKDVANKATRGMVGLRKARRLAQTIVDLVSEDRSLMLGLATIKEFDDYTYTHSVNVALLSSCLGRHIGMSDVSLEYLTVCGLFHDLGKVGVPREILNKEGALTPDEWERMKAHSLLGVGQILKLNAPPSLRSRIILGPFEHHLNPDMTGYPPTLFMHRLSLLGRILRIADIYEALTARRAYRTRAYAPDEALRRMWREAGKSFDTILLKSFIQMMGIYPIGSLVELTDGAIALVMEYPDDARKMQPLVLIPCFQLN